MNSYARLIPRLNGGEIEEKFSYYLDLVKKGVAGFIVFGGELETVRARLAELQAASHYPLIIASDLEQGLGQQIEGGTVFPPAMAIASAITPPSPPLAKGGNERGVSSKLNLLRKTFKAIALEARYAGINTIFAPVLDINTNPDNPIIATRAFGEDPATVSFFGCEMIKVLQRNGIIACGKHFPGHGDTEVDSHISLPVVRKGLHSLEQNELVPFKKAVGEGVDMIMLGHLSVPALDPSERPASLSDKAVAYLRDRMEFGGAIITDAMNMGGIGRYTEKEASLMALNAGVDIILHPSDPDAVAAYLLEKNCFTSKTTSLSFPGLTGESRNALDARLRTSGMTYEEIDFASHQRLSDELAGMAVTIEGKSDLRLTKPFMIILKEDKVERGGHFANALKKRYAGFRYCSVMPGDEIPWSALPRGHDLLVGVFSQVKAWKGQTGAWVRRAVESLDGRARLFISFGNPYVLRNVRDAARIYAYWDSRSAQESVAERLLM